MRETPLNRTHLTNMLAVHDAGAIICPRMPAFYSKPESFEAMARNYAARLCDLLDIPVKSKAVQRWQGV